MNWKDYEKEIYHYFKEMYPKTNIRFDQKVLGKFSKVDRQIDVLIESETAGFSFRIIIDCKHFNKKIDVREVETFCSMVEDVDADQGLLITTKGFSTAAINRAYYGKQRVELDVVNFDVISNFQGLFALPFAGNYSVILPAPFGWVIDAKNKSGGVASLFQRGLSLDQAQKRNEWMYINFWEVNDNKIFCIDDLINMQNKEILSHDPEASFEYEEPLGREDKYNTKIRVACINSYPCLEVTGFVQFDDFIFFAVLFTPKQLLSKNLKKIKYLLTVCRPVCIHYDN